MDGVDTHTLVRTYEPVLLFSRDGKGLDESFFPMDAEQFVLDARLYDEDSSLLLGDGELSFDVLDGTTAKESEGSFLVYGLDYAFEFLGDGKGWVRRLGMEGSTSGSGALELPEAPVDESVSRAAGSQARSEFADSRRLPHAVRDRVLANYSRCRDLNENPPPYYYRVMSDAGYLVIQYWMFYAYNDWGLAHSGLNDHEGDWEAVFVYLQGDTPAYVAYSAHVGTPATHAWSSEEFDMRLGTHPVVYVACGSHAAYSKPGKRRIVIRSAPGVDKPLWFTDYARGDSEESLGPGASAEWGTPVDLESRPWALNFAGRWGAAITRLDEREIGRGAQGPVGPPWQTEKWESPVKWAQIND